jgi:PKD repeat protein
MANTDFTWRPIGSWTIQFSDTSFNSANPTQKPTSWSWNFGDGSAAGSGEYLQHDYPVEGTYTVTLTTIWPGGATTSISKNIFRPAYWTHYSRWTAVVTGGRTVTFTDTSELNDAYPDAVITSWRWSFGDGSSSISTERNPTHTYATSGDKGVVLETAWSEGPSASYYNTVTTTTPPQHTSNFTWVANGQTLTFTDTSTPNAAYPGAVATAWLWNFGDGTSNATVRNPIHTFTPPGNYFVNLTTTWSAGPSTSSTGKSITVGPTATNTTDFSVVTNGMIATFTDTSTANAAYPGAVVTSWYWQFGDGRTSDEQNPVKTYFYIGNFNVTLTTTWSAGPTSAKTKPLVISIPNQSNFVVYGGGLTRIFADTSKVGYPGATITGWAWNFGDGTTSTQQNPFHTFLTEGSYTVTLNTTWSAGTTNPHSESITVAAPVTSTKWLEPLPATANGSSSGLVSGDTVEWFRNAQYWFDAYHEPASQGKRYFEIVADDISTQTNIGFAVAPFNTYEGVYDNSPTARWIVMYDGRTGEGGYYTQDWDDLVDVNFDYGTTEYVENGSVLGFAIDLDAGHIDAYYLNGVRVPLPLDYMGDPDADAEWAIINNWPPNSVVRPTVFGRSNFDWNASPHMQFTVRATIDTLQFLPAGYKPWVGERNDSSGGGGDGGPGGGGGGADRPLPDLLSDVNRTDFYALPRNGDAPLTVTFYDTSTPGVTMPWATHTCEWVWGDGTPNGYGSIITHTYERVGDYSPTLRTTWSQHTAPQLERGSYIHVNGSTT